MWEFNLSRCFFLVLSILLICLKCRVLPHYFIQEKNLIIFSAYDINTLCIYVESFRVFPLKITQFVVEKHAYGPNLVRSILKDTQFFAKSREIHVDPLYQLGFL